MTDREMLQSMDQKLDVMKLDIDGLHKFERKALEHYVTRDYCSTCRQACAIIRDKDAANLKWGVGVILTLGALTITGLTFIGSWASGK